MSLIAAGCHPYCYPSCTGPGFIPIIPLRAVECFYRYHHARHIIFSGELVCIPSALVCYLCMCIGCPHDYRVCRLGLPFPTSQVMTQRMYYASTFGSSRWNVTEKGFRPNETYRILSADGARILESSQQRSPFCNGKVKPIYSSSLLEPNIFTQLQTFTIVYTGKIRLFL